MEETHWSAGGARTTPQVKDEWMVDMCFMLYVTIIAVRFRLHCWVIKKNFTTFRRQNFHRKVAVVRYWFHMID